MRSIPKVAFVVPVRGRTKMGLSYRGVRVGEVVQLLPEPSNPVDPHAILVTRQDHYPLGYLPRDVAGRIDPREWSATVEEIYKRRSEPTGIRLRLDPV